MEASFDQLAEGLYKAPFVLLAHNKFEEGVTDPVFTYANKAALEAFEGTWDEIVGLPSRYSAEEGTAREVGTWSLSRTQAHGPMTALHSSKAPCSAAVQLAATEQISVATDRHLSVRVSCYVSSQQFQVWLLCVCRTGSSC